MWHDDLNFMHAMSSHYNCIVHGMLDWCYAASFANLLLVQMPVN